MFRKLQMSDREVYLEMVGEFYHSDAVLHPVPVEYHINTFNEIMRSDEYLECYMLEDEGEAVGFALLSKSFSPEVGGPIVWVEEIYLREGHRGKGIGKAFFAYMHEHIPAARFRLEIEPDNKRAEALYSSMGYTELGYKQMVRDTDKIKGEKA